MARISGGISKVMNVVGMAFGAADFAWSLIDLKSQQKEFDESKERDYEYRENLIQLEELQKQMLELKFEAVQVRINTNARKDTLDVLNSIDNKLSLAIHEVSTLHDCWISIRKDMERMGNAAANGKRLSDKEKHLKFDMLLDELSSMRLAWENVKSISLT